MPAPAGFYPNPDPNEPTLERYWDGNQWTGQTRPVGTPTVAGFVSEGTADRGEVSPILAAHGHDNDDGSSRASAGAWKVRTRTSSSPVGMAIGALVATAFVIVGFFMFKGMSPDMVQPTPVTATVVSLEESESYRDGRRTVSCGPVVEFTATDGQTYRVPSRFYASDMCDYRVGQQVQIEYDALDPMVVSGLASPVGTYMPLLFMGVGLLILVGLVVGIVRRVVTR